MKINRAVKLKAYLNKAQKRQADTTLGHCRYVYNHMLTRNEKMYKRRGDHLSYNEMQNLLPVMKKYLPWLKEADSQALKYACRQLDTAYQNFFKGRGDYPKPHKKRSRQSYTTTNKSAIRIIDRHHIQIPTLGSVYVRGLRDLPAEAKTGYATISHEPDGSYYISLAYSYEIPNPIISNTKAIGLDYKVDCLYVPSEGERPAVPNWFDESQGKLTKAQQTLSHKVGSRKGEKKSHNWHKAKRKVNKIHRKTANQRRDFLHKQSKWLVDNYGTVCIETLPVKGILVDYADVGNHVAEHNINKAIFDDGWYMFTLMLDYKLAERGGKLIKVSEDYKSTETCSVCGRVEPSVKDLKVRKWICPVCKTAHDRDANAAANILNEGLRLLKAS